MTTNRHLSDVIDELIAAEPKLTSILESSLMRTRYCAPEMMTPVAVVQQQIVRRWRTCAFVKFSAPELSLDHRRYSCLATDWTTVEVARDKVWDFRSAVKGRGWLFWIEPEGMTEAEVKKYRPLDVRDAVVSV